MSDLRYNIPSGWEVVSLQDVCSKITDGTHKTPEYQDEGVRFISIKNVRPYKPIRWEAYEKYITLEDHQELSKRCNPEYDDIVFPRIGTLGFAKRIDFHEEVSLFVGLGLLKPIKSIVLPRYLEGFMNSSLINRLSQERATGTGRLTLSLAESRKLPIVIPPIEEQQRIVDTLESYLSRLDDAVASLERVQTKLKQYRASVLKAAVDGRLVPTEAELARSEGRDYVPASLLLNRILEERKTKWIEDAAEKGRAKAGEKAKKAGKSWSAADDQKALENEKIKAQKKYKEPAAPDTEGLPELPEGWCWVTLGQLAWKVKDGPHYSPKYVEEGI